MEARSAKWNGEEKKKNKKRERKWVEVLLYLGHLAHHVPGDHQPLNEGTCCHKCACDHQLHCAGYVSEGPQCLDLLRHTLQVVLACNQRTVHTVYHYGEFPVNKSVSIMHHH